MMETDTRPPRPTPAGKAAQRALIGWAAVFTLLLGVAAGVVWTRNLDEYWSDDTYCASWFSLASDYRHLLSFAAIGLAVAVIGSLTAIGLGRYGTRAVTVYWMASAGFWLTAAAMAVALYGADCWVDFRGGRF